MYVQLVQQLLRAVPSTCANQIILRAGLYYR